MERETPFQLVAGHPALDFANTLDNRYAPGQVIDLIPTYRELVRFCLEAGIITSRQARALSGLDHGTEAALRTARELREALERIFVTAVEGSEAPAGDLAILNRAVQESTENRVITCDAPGSFGWRWIDFEGSPCGPVWAIADAATNLLISDGLRRVRRCGSESCRWLFLDASKNHSRRWCDMKLCGNRVKARNYYERGRKEHPQRASEGN